MAHHPLPENIVVVECTCYNRGVLTALRPDFERWCAKIPLLGLLALGHEKFMPKKLDVDVHGKLVVKVLEELEITLHEFTALVQIIRWPNYACSIDEVRTTAVKLCVMEYAEPLVQKETKRQNKLILCESDDFENVFEWKVVGPTSPYVVTNFKQYEQEGWSFVKYDNLRETAVFYTLRKPKTP